MILASMSSVTTINFPIVRVTNIPGVFHLDEIVVPDSVQLPQFTTGPDGRIDLSGISSQMPLTQVPQYINHEGEPVAVHLHTIDGVLNPVILRGLHKPRRPVKRIRIPPTEQSKRFTIEVGLEVAVK
jgi:hypothetical protein